MTSTNTGAGISQGLGQLVLEALRTDHRLFSVNHGRAHAYMPSIAPFAALTEDTVGAWEDLKSVSHDAIVARTADFEPEGWALAARLSLTRMTAPPGGVTARMNPTVANLGEDQIPAMRTLLEQCGLQFGNSGITAVARFVGIYEGPQLIAMAGSRFSTPRWREISQLGTHPDYQGRGLARTLIAELIRRHTASGRNTFLGVESANPARQYYRNLGFTDGATERIEHRQRIA